MSARLPIVDRALRSVAEVWGTTPDQITSRSRSWFHASARFTAYDILTTQGLPQKQCSSALGGKGNTLSHQLKTFRDTLDTDPAFRARVERVRELFAKSA